MQLNSELLEFHIGNIDVVKAMPKLPVEEPFSADRIAFLNEISRELLTDKEAKKYSDVVTFAFWLRRANMEKQKRDFFVNHKLRMGRGIVFHIAPSNVAVNYAYSFAVGFILGNANIVRLPSREFPQVDMINRSMLAVMEKREEYKKWSAYVVFLRYERNKEVNDFLSSICDFRVIWGGDSSISEIRKSELPPRAGEITFADRYSICMIEAEAYLNSPEKEKLAAGFYNDTYLMDQNACTSPRMVCWLGNREVVRQAKEIFWNKLWNIVSQRYVFQPVQYVDKLTEACLAATRIDGMRVIRMRDNRIVRIELEQIDPIIQKYRGNSGFFYEYETNDVMELIPLCNEKLQTIAYLGNEKNILPLVRAGVKGIDRVVPIGSTLEFDFVWDGYDLRERMTRRVTVRRNKE